MGHVLILRKGSTHTAPVALPSGYTRLTYIQSSGTQYIDTGFKPNQNTRIVADMDLTITATDIGLFGARAAYGSLAFTLFAVQSGAAIQTGFGGVESNQTCSVTGRHMLDKDKNLVYCDGTLVYTHTAATFNCGINARIFQVANASQSGGDDNNTWASAKLYSCQIYDNGTLVRDYVPCINASAEVGLYDLVGKQFYGNAGTGVFTGGEA